MSRDANGEVMKLKYQMVFGLIVLATLLPLLVFFFRSGNGGEGFLDLSRKGKVYYERGETAKAVEILRKALAKNPASLDAVLNVAVAELAAGNTAEVILLGQKALELDKTSATAHYLLGCAEIRTGKKEEALKEFQQARDADPNELAANYWLGVAHQGLGHWEDAAASLEDAVSIEPEHPAAHYALSQVYLRMQRSEEAQRALGAHQKLQSKLAANAGSVTALEKSKYTVIRVPIEIERPDPVGIPVRFADATTKFLGTDAAKYSSPLALIDLNKQGVSGVVVREGNAGVRILAGDAKGIKATGAVMPMPAGFAPTRVLASDLDHDRVEDVLVLSESGTLAFQLSSNGVARDATRLSGLQDVRAVEGELVDLDFTGKLDLLTVQPDGQGIRVFRNRGNWTFGDMTSTSGIPTGIQGARRLILEDFDNNDLVDLFVERKGQAPSVFSKQRGGVMEPTTKAPFQFAADSVIALGDVDNDLRADGISVAGGKLRVAITSTNRMTEYPVTLKEVRNILLFDYDNDGWQDIVLSGSGLAVYRNLGDGKFEEVSTKLGIPALAIGEVDAVVARDFDNDSGTDLLISERGKGLRYLHNEGGNANYQLKLRLAGNRSNASGLGMRVEVTAGGLRMGRRSGSMPMELGMGKHKQTDAVTTHWFDLEMNSLDLGFKEGEKINLFELILPTGSCPYVYAWDGSKYRFVSDILGASPLGLPVAEGKYIDADPDELVWLGNGDVFKPRGSNYTVQITEELREVLYLDQAALVYVDHPAGTTAHSTSKLLPRGPYPPHQIKVHARPVSLVKATRNDGLDVTELLQSGDRRMVSPVALRPPQYRGLAEPYSVTLDFGPLPASNTRVLALTGWLRFGGGMANIAGSHNPEFPFPFPQLEAELPNGEWKLIAVTVGAPAGKTKTIIVELGGKLPEGTRRLRVSTAFEIHWDQAQLFEEEITQGVVMGELLPMHTDLHWRGFSRFEDLPASLPLTPNYALIDQKPSWTLAVNGWCTRYGPVDELVAGRDNALAMVNGGDELTLEFPASTLPPIAPGMIRDFFLKTTGWDKDADFHCVTGWQLDPIPWLDMNYQTYGHAARPAMTNDAWMAKYNRRWVGPFTFDRQVARRK